MIQKLQEIMESAALSQVKAASQVRCEFDLLHVAHFYSIEIAQKNPTGHVRDEKASEEIFTKLQAWQQSFKSGLILAGNMGNGKTTIARALYLANRYFVDRNAVGMGKEYKLPSWVTEKQIVGMVEAGKDEVYEKLESKNVVFIDDLGEAATEVNRYGTIKTPVVDLLEVRYARRLPTIITTNLNADAIREKYGERVWDRLRETCEVVAFINSSFRK